MVPVTGSQSLRLRRPLNQDELQDTFAVLSSAAKLPQKAWNRRFKEYNDNIRRGAVLDVASVLRDLWAMKHAKTLSYGEKHLLEKAWELMESELLLAYQYDKPRIKGLLEEALERQFEGISIALPH
jgi:CarD family transcriptional regulator